MYQNVPKTDTYSDTYMTPKYFLKTDRTRADGLAPIYIILRHKDSKAEIATDIFLAPSAWDGKRIIAADRINRRKSLLLEQWWLDVQDILLELRGHSIRDIKEAIIGRLFPDRAPAPGHRLVDMFGRFIATKSGRTAEVYEATRTKVERHSPDITLDEITPAWLTEFERSMASLSVNARSIHLRNIRAVVNYAIDNDLTANYPFRKFRIKHEATRKRSLTVEQLRKLFTMEVEDWQREYRDFFVLTFLLIGINAVDLLHVQGPVAGRIEYQRSKTKRLYSIKLEPEAAEVAARLRGKAWWLRPLDRYANYRDYLHRANKAMQSVGKVERVGRGGRKVISPAFPGITSYWMRHSWATIAASLDIPKDTIAAALGHGGNSVTDIYIDFDQRKVDEANRRVIDWVIYGKKNPPATRQGDQ